MAIPYIIVCAPSGCGLTEAVEKLKASLGQDIAHEDLEGILLGSVEANKKLEAKGITKPKDTKSWPGMYELTWYLARSEVTELWRMAAEQSLLNIARKGGSIKVLSCHLTYYNGRRTEFYSPITSSVLAPESLKSGSLGSEPLKPSHVLLLIDDVYDMYARLTADRQLFSPKTLIPRRFSRLKDDEGIDIKQLPLEHNIDICAQWKIAVMTQLLSWRHFETLTAERFARELDAEFMVWGTKQLTKAVGAWLSGKSKAIYLSHPISRPRRMFREMKEWDPVVREFNKLQANFSQRGITCVMPSAIDEYRINREDSAGGASAGPGKHRLPELEERWPLPSTTTELLYAPPSKGQYIGGPQHYNILALQAWNKDTRSLETPFGPHSRLLFERIDVILRSLEQQVQLQISARDHSFVAITDGLIVFRPLFAKGEFSSGVEAEIRHWSVIAKAEDKRIVFIHFEDDILKFQEYVENDAKQSARKEGDIYKRLLTIVVSEHGFDTKVAADIASAIERDSPEEILDAGTATAGEYTEVASRLSRYRRRAEKEWQEEALCFASAWAGAESESKDLKALVRQIIVKDMDALNDQYEEIAQFLKGEAVSAHPDGT